MSLGWRVLLLLALTLGAAALAGCMDQAPEPASGPDADSTTGEGHPYPSDDDWPEDLAGPFAVDVVTEHRVASFDGTERHGWIVRPDVPNGTEVPVVLWSSPYFGQCSDAPPTPATGDCAYPIGDAPRGWDNSNRAESVPVRLLVEHGYAVAIWNVRGTGNSEGCFDFFGPREQRDQAQLVNWLGNRSWSNGRVGMMGVSYHGTTPWEAALMNPEPLKTIVTGGMVSNLYTLFHSPQGAAATIIDYFNTHYLWRVSLSPPFNGPVEHWTTEHAPVVPDRACPELAPMLAESPKDHWTDHRSEDFWEPRRLIQDFGDIETSVFLTMGFHDPQHFQDDAVWGTLDDDVPARMLVGQWGHEFPNYNHHRDDYVMTDWNETLLEWFDYWLKGVGEQPDLGVDYQDTQLEWHESDAWPPSEAQDEVLYLREGALETDAGEASSSFESILLPNGPRRVLCQPDTGPAPPPGRVFTTGSLDEPVTVAGNPKAYLNVESTQPGGLVAVHLFDLGPDFTCTDGTPEDTTLATRGVADLRFHEGNYVGENFPVLEPTHVRVDLRNLAHVLEPDHQLAAVLSAGAPVGEKLIGRSGQPYSPTITLHGGEAATASQVVLPVTGGSLGGPAPAADYPPRPFVPQSG